MGLGGIVGANCRLLVSESFGRRFGLAFPYGTLFINLTGSFVLSLFLTLVSRQWLTDPAYRWLIAVGFCGGYTTFSTYTYETLGLLREGRVRAGLVGYWLGSLVLGLLAAWLGYGLGNLT